MTLFFKFSSLIAFKLRKKLFYFIILFQDFTFSRENFESRKERKLLSNY